ncbi:MAG: hypothetical protein QXU67_06385, partial [Candidatus Bathyarchaeia archaeon]
YICPRVKNTFELIDNAYYFALKHDLLSNWLDFTTFIFLESRRPAWEQRYHLTSYLHTWIRAFINANRRYKASERSKT